MPRRLNALAAFALLLSAGANGARAGALISTTVYSSNATYTAPAGTGYIVVKAWGAGGGEGTGAANGGAGAFVTAQYNMSPGQTATVVVGTAGSGSYAAGAPGGGAGSGLGAAGGGGYTSVASPSGAVYAAGGGGGGNNGGNGTGGAGGEPNGQGGTNWNGGTPSGGGATQSGGGGGGYGPPANGNAGGYLQGGSGGTTADYAGGGGGGGYFGGGGGASNVEYATPATGGGCGGGGSSNVTGSPTSYSYGNSSGSVPGGTTDPNYPGSGVGYGGTAGTYSNGYNGAVVILAYSNIVALTSVSITGPTTYTGSPLTPTYVTTPAGGTVSFTPTTETNAGNYTLSWTGTGSYSGSGSAGWTISPATLTAATIQAPGYTGSAQRPSAVSSVTPPGAPVTVSSSAAHSAVGSYTDGIVSLAASANYNAGTLSGLSWSITPMAITAATIQSVLDNGSAQQPTAVSSVTPSGATVSVSSSSSHTGAGTYTDGIVTGTGNYSGTLSGLSWTITAQSQAAVAISPTSIGVQLGQSAVLTASGGSGTGAFTFTNTGTVVSSSNTSITDTVTFGNIGNDSVSVYKAADSNYSQSNTASATVTVSKATPVAALANQSISTTTALTSQMLNAVFSNPFSGSVVQPTGTVTYTASENGTNYGAVTVGSTLPLGVFQITASYPGDANYNAASTSATFTVSALLAKNTYNYVGGTATYTAPANTNYIVVKAWGAGGGEGVQTPGAGGGFVTTAVGHIPVGQTLTVYVGGAGSGYQNGGWPGGGSAAALGGAGGGGYSRVTANGFDIWAGGGGGGGNGANWSGWGGGGGGPAGQTGYGPGTTPGGGGTQSAGGVGGTGSTANGTQGSFGQGGSSVDPGGGGYAGGGGGGGYYGGGGAGSGSYGNGGSGGGGGSSLISVSTSIFTGGALSPVYSNAFELTPGGTADPDYPGGNIAYGGSSGTYVSGYNGYVVIASYEQPGSPTLLPGAVTTENYVLHQPVSYTIPAIAEPAILSYSATGLPAGLTLNTTTGVITGAYITAITPLTPPTTSITLTTQVTVTNSVGSLTFPVTWNFYQPTFGGATTFTSQNQGAFQPGWNISIQCSSSISGLGPCTDGLAWTDNTLFQPQLGGGQVADTFGRAYATGAPATFNNSPTSATLYQIPSATGIYTYDLRVTDIYGNYQDFDNIFQVSPEQDPLPYTTSFETGGSPSYLLGNIFPQYGWMLWQGLGDVVTPGSGTWPGPAPLVLPPVNNGADSLDVGVLAYVQKNFTAGSQGTFVDVFAMPVATTSYANSSIIDNGSSRIGFQISGTNQGTIWVENGDGNGGGTWQPTTFTFPTNSSGQSTQWIRLTAYHNYSTHKWNFYSNGVLMGGVQSPTVLGMISTIPTSFTQLTWYGASSAASYMDALTATTAAQLFDTPATPGQPTVTTLQPTVIGLSWVASSDQYGLAGYQVKYTPSGGSASTVWIPAVGSNPPPNTVTLSSGLTQGTTYVITVQAESVSGILSAISPQTTVTTPILETLQLAAGEATFTYNGTTQTNGTAQSPPQNSTTFTVSPAGATYAISGQTSAINAGNYSFQVTANGNYWAAAPLNVPWVILQAPQNVTISPTSANVQLNVATGFTASGGQNGYVWSVTPTAGSSGNTGSGTSQNLSFSAAALSGTPPRPIPYAVSVYSSGGGNFLQSPPATSSVSVTVPTNPDPTNGTVQLNVHAPTH